MYSSKLKQIFTIHHIKSVLDLGAGTGEFSLLASQMGAKVVAVDNLSMKNWHRNSALDGDGNITFIKNNVEDFILKLNQNFDLVLLLNVIAFIKKDDFLSLYFPRIIKHINRGGLIIVNFFFADDPTMQKIQHYSFENFDIYLENLAILEKEDIRVDDDHAPYGLHKHHIGHYIFQKK